MTAARRTLRSRGESGYTLLIVLVACGLFGLILMSLLTMVSTDARTSSAYFKTDTAKRAIDGGLQVGIGTLKATPSSVLRAGTDPCAGLTTAQTLPIEGRTVSIDCTPSGTPPTVLPTSGDGNPVLTLLRNYDIGAVDDLGRFLKDVITRTGGTVANYPGLAHWADEPLRIFGSTKVRQSGVGSTPLWAGSSAITVQGNYQQGDPSGSCGPWIGNVLLPDRQQTVSASGTRWCGDGSPTARDYVTPLAPTAPASTVPTAAAALPASCAGPVVQLQPGTYTPAQMATLNSWLGAGVCDGVTFWFPPGDYLFDAAAATTSGSIRFDDPTSNVVFGEPLGWATGAATATVAGTFPQACDRDKPGVSIVLGPTTSIDHRRGRVAMCGKGSGPTDPAMVSQQPAVTLTDEAWAGEPEVATRASTLETLPERVTRTVAIPTEPPGYPALGRRYDTREGTLESQRLSSSVTCTPVCAPGWVLSDWGADTAPTRALSTAVVKVRGSTSTARATPFNPFNNPLGDNSKTVVTVSLPGTPARGCTAFDYVYPTSMTTPVTIDLFGAHSNCRDVITSARDLASATITVYVAVHGDCYTWFCTPYATINVDYVWLETHTSTTPVEPPQMNLNIDPNNGSTFTAFGRFFVPRIQIDVKWRGRADSPPANELPLFVGDLTARSLGSSPISLGIHVGPLAARHLVPTSRNVIVRVSESGRLLGTATLRVVDVNAAGTALEPARQLDVTDWSYCNIPLTPTARC